MTFTPRFLDELRDRVGLGELIGRRVKLSRSGRELKGLCPFHSEKTPSFHVVEDKGFYHCFGCGAHGDAIGWLMETERFSFPEAVADLARRVGLELPKPDAHAANKAEARAGLHEVMEAAARVFQEQLGKADGRAARSYLEGRGIDPRTALDFRLGYAPESRGALKAALFAQGIAVEQMVEAGLLKRPDSGGDPFDYFRNRLIFPITDRRGRVIALGGRALDDNPAKYLNSPETSLFHKGRTLYNLARARKAAHDAGSVVVVEGYMDVIALARSGFDHAVAPLGTALTEEQIEELWRLAPEPVLCFDGDKAGMRAALRAIDRALPLLRPGQSLRFALLPEGLDPDDLIRREGAGAIKAVIEAAAPLSDMLWRTMTETADTSTPERRAGLEKAVIGRLFTIRDDKVREFYLRDFRDRLFRAYRPPWLKPRGRGAGSARTGGRLPGGSDTSRLRATPLARSGRNEDTSGIEQLAMLFCVNHPKSAETHAEELAAVEFADPDLDKLRAELLVTLGSAQDLDRQALRAHLAENGFAATLARLEGAPLAGPARWVWPDATPQEAETGWRHLMARLRRLALRREIAALEAAYREDGSDETLLRLVRLKQEFDGSDGTEAELEGYVYRPS